MQQEIVDQIIYILGTAFKYSVYTAILFIPLKMLVKAFTGKERFL